MHAGSYATAVENHGKLFFVSANACPRRIERRGGGGRRNSSCGGFGVAQQMMTHTYRKPPRKHFPPDRQGTPRKDNRQIVNNQQRYRHDKRTVPACSGCGGPPHDDRRMRKAWGTICYKCQKLNHFANVCKANIQQTHLVVIRYVTTHTHLACVTQVLLTQYHHLQCSDRG